MEHEEAAITRRRREDKHPLLTLLMKYWQFLSSLATVGIMLFLALGFEFQTPASWIREVKAEQVAGQRRTDARIEKLEETHLELVSLMRILAREACNNFSPEQLRVTPSCDDYVDPPRSGRRR